MPFQITIVRQILSVALYVTLSHQLNCNEYRDCSCKSHSQSNNIELECHDTIAFTISGKQNLTARCLSDVPTLKLPNFPSANFRYLTLIDCINKSYFDKLIQMLPLNHIDTVNLTGHPNLRRLAKSSIAKLLVAKKIKNLAITSYEIDEELPDANTLQVLSVTFCSIKLQSNFFNSSTNLIKIVLSNNEITTIPPKLFQPVKHVEEIDLSTNNLILLLGNPFQSLRYLRKLNLKGNNLTLLTENMLLNLVNLGELNLRGNNIRYISPDALFIHRYFGRLKTIDLSYNNLTLWEEVDPVIVTPFSRIYREPQHLHLLDLRNNKIQHFLHEWMTFPCADILDLRYNNITQIDLTKLQTIFAFGKVLNLDDDVDLHGDSKYNNTIFLKGNLVASDEKLRNLTRYYNFIRSSTALQSVFDLNDLTCVKSKEGRGYSCKLGPKFCPAHCTCSVHPWESLFDVDCANRGLRVAPRLNVPRFFNVAINLSKNLLTTGPRATDGYTDVIHLYLSHNRLVDLNWVPPKIEVLKIDDNNISSLDETVISKIRSARNLKQLELGRNPWICDCEIFNLIELLKSLQPTGKVNLDNVFCRNSSIKITSLNYNEVCNVYRRLKLTVVLVTLGMIVGITAALCYKYKEEIRIMLSVRDLLPFTALDGNKAKDAFVCYTYEDEQFVLNELLPLLEDGLNQYVIGIHFRDWVAGEFITDQITRSIEEAKRTIIVLSPQFLKSRWGITEFRMAHDLAMRGLTRVIIVLYQDVKFEEVPDEALKKYLATRSYIRWNDKKFWVKLKSALPRVPDRWCIMSYNNLLQKEESLIPSE